LINNKIFFQGKKILLFIKFYFNFCQTIFLQFFYLISSLKVKLIFLFILYEIRTHFYSYTLCVINYEKKWESERSTVRAEMIVSIRNKRKSTLVCTLILDGNSRDLTKGDRPNGKYYTSTHSTKTIRRQDSTSALYINIFIYI